MKGGAARVRGFTLIELLVVMAILGVLAAAVMPLGEMMLRAQKERELRSALNEIRMALDEYRQAVKDGVIKGAPASGYPPSLQALVEGVPDTRSLSGDRRHYFLRRIPRDPFADPTVPADRTWLLRSYASPPEKPAPGADVYDVHSSSDLKGLDGTSYGSW